MLSSNAETARSQREISPGSTGSSSTELSNLTIPVVIASPEATCPTSKESGNHAYQGDDPTSFLQSFRAILQNGNAHPNTLGSLILECRQSDGGLFGKYLSPEYGIMGLGFVARLIGKIPAVSSSINQRFFARNSDPRIEELAKAVDAAGLELRVTDVIGNRFFLGVFNKDTRVALNSNTAAMYVG